MDDIINIIVVNIKITELEIKVDVIKIEKKNYLEILGLSIIITI